MLERSPSALAFPVRRVVLEQTNSSVGFPLVLKVITGPEGGVCVMQVKQEATDTYVLGSLHEGDRVLCMDNNDTTTVSKGFPLSESSLIFQVLCEHSFKNELAGLVCMFEMTWSSTS
jgi:hypothetical protein